MSFDTVDVLRKAATLLEDKGWIRGSFRRNGAHCTVGAIREVVLGGCWQSEVREAIAVDLGLDPSKVFGLHSLEVINEENRRRDVVLRVCEELVDAGLIPRLAELPHSLPHSFGADSVIEWNDRKAADVTQVVETLRKSADKIEQENRS